ncbi:FAD dependent oxidoreductase [Xylariomycetidae sp. FL0641]|nr:FAD dependent oxidoreductase [Xylariomycetidae sp. FL0641]
MPHVVVLGAGVIGLSAALRIQEDGHAVTLLAKDFPSGSETIETSTHLNYTSPWGGAHNRLVPPSSPTAPEAREHRMARATFAHLRRLPAAAAGITFLKGVEYLEAPDATYRALTARRARDELGMEGFRLLREEEFPDDKVTWGCEYDTWCVNPMVYCAFLLRRLVFRGARVVRRDVRDPREVFELPDLGRVDVLVNASGNGFGDPAMFITRGQTCLVANTCAATVTRQNADGSWTFCVPRSFEGGTVIGGTKEPDNWDPAPSAAVRERLLGTFAATHPPILDSEGGRFRVLRDIVGRRPTRRGGLRLEAEETAGDGASSRCIIHAYGLGGRGYELSWGVAEGVAELLAKHLGAGASSRQAKL